MTTTTTQPRRETLQQRIARAGQTFDLWRLSGCTHAVCRDNGVAVPVRPGQLDQVLTSVLERDRTTLVIELAPRARVDFIAWAISPGRKQSN